ncbi:hypothetical protein ACFRR7_35320 [Streptomyces sp. NPDC056909]
MAKSSPLAAIRAARRLEVTAAEVAYTHTRHSVAATLVPTFVCHIATPTR